MSGGNGLLDGPIYCHSSQAGKLPRRFFTNASISRRCTRTNVRIVTVGALFRLCDLGGRKSTALRVTSHLLFVPSLFDCFLAKATGGRCDVTSASRLLSTHDQA